MQPVPTQSISSPTNCRVTSSKKNHESLDYLASHSKIQLASGGQICADQLQVGQLHGAKIALRVEKIHQRGAAVLVSVGYSVPNARGLAVVFCFVGFEQRNVALDLSVSGIHVAEDLGARRVSQLMLAANVDLCALLFSLIPVEDA